MRSILLIISVAVCIYSCEEIGPDIILEETAAPLTDTTYVITNVPQSQSKAVYIEEFSGVRCNNCPQGNQKIEDFIISYGQRIVPVTVHTSILGQPYANNENLNTQDGEDLANNLGPVNIKPSAFIDRKEFPNENNRLVLLNTWDTHVNSQLNTTTPVNIELEQVSFDAIMHVFRYKVTLTYTQNSANQYMGVLLTENELVAAQLDGPDIIDNYVHEHVLRAFLTPIQGIPIESSISLVPGRVIEREYETVFEDNWMVEHMNLIVFIRADNQDVVHAAQMSLTL